MSPLGSGYFGNSLYPQNPARYLPSGRFIDQCILGEMQRRVFEMLEGLNCNMCRQYRDTVPAYLTEHQETEWNLHKDGR
jgi:hypothetical protein